MGGEGWSWAGREARVRVRGGKVGGGWVGPAACAATPSSPRDRKRRGLGWGERVGGGGWVFGDWVSVGLGVGGWRRAGGGNRGRVCGIMARAYLGL